MWFIGVVRQRPVTSQFIITQILHTQSHIVISIKLQRGWLGLQIRVTVQLVTNMVYSYTAKWRNKFNTICKLQSLISQVQGWYTKNQPNAGLITSYRCLRKTDWNISMCEEKFTQKKWQCYAPLFFQLIKIHITSILSLFPLLARCKHTGSSKPAFSVGE